jgi:hypothetical protein
VDATGLDEGTELEANGELDGRTIDEEAEDEAGELEGTTELEGVGVGVGLGVGLGVGVTRIVEVDWTGGGAQL